MKVIFYFTAEWCEPCKKTKPIMEQFVQENENITLVIIDIDKDQEIATELGIMAVPTFILFENEKEIFRASGSMNKEGVRKFVYGEH